MSPLLQTNQPERKYYRYAPHIRMRYIGLPSVSLNPLNKTVYRRISHRDAEVLAGRTDGVTVLVEMTGAAREALSHLVDHFPKLLVGPEVPIRVILPVSD